MLNKEILNQNRVLTMSNNRKGDYLIINNIIDESRKRNSVIVMVIIDNNISKDIIFIKQIDINNYIEEVLDIYKEFNICKKIVIDINGYGNCLYEELEQYIKPSDKIEKVINIGLPTYIIPNIINDINFGKLRFLQSSNCAKVSYRKPFLGYYEIMNSHRETDKLIDEIDNVDIVCTTNGSIKLDFKNKKIGHSRFYCLHSYYAILLDND